MGNVSVPRPRNPRHLQSTTRTGSISQPPRVEMPLSPVFLPQQLLVQTATRIACHRCRPRFGISSLTISNRQRVSWLSITRVCQRTAGFVVENRSMAGDAIEVIEVGWRFLRRILELRISEGCSSASVPSESMAFQLSNFSESVSFRHKMCHEGGGVLIRLASHSLNLSQREHGVKSQGKKESQEWT